MARHSTRRGTGSGLFVGRGTRGQFEHSNPIQFF